MGSNSSFSKMIFQEVSKPEKLAWHHSMTDSDWNIGPNPMMPDWPQTILNTVTFSTMGNETMVSLSQIPIDATDAQIECFIKMVHNMDGGWGKGYAIMDEILVQLLMEENKL